MKIITKIATAAIVACMALTANSQQEKKTRDQLLDEVAKIVEARASAMRLCKLMPSGLAELSGVFNNAEDGHNLASAPKIKADGKFYYFSGVISPVADEKGFILESRLLSDRQDAPGVSVYWKTAPSGPEYISIQPNNDVTKEKYLSRGKVGRDVIGVGRYVYNTSITMASGATQKIPHFNIIYLMMPHNEAK